MTYKIVYQLDDAGYFIGETIAQESPLEPGIFLIPRNAVELAPPDHNAETHRVHHSVDSWTIEEIVPVVVPPPVLTPEEIRQNLTSAVTAHMDATAQSLGYSSIYTAVTYADEPAVPKFQNEGRALRAWRSLVWAQCYVILAEVTAGTRPVPTPSELIVLLPAFVPPAV